MKNWSKKDRRKSLRRKPDDYFSAGPLEFARFGNVAISRSRATPEQWKSDRVEMAKRLPEVMTDIDVIVTRIADRVARLPPELLLQRAWWELTSLMVLTDGGPSDGERATAMRMIDYAQSVVASVDPILPYTEQVGDEDWRQLSQDVRDLFARLTLDYQLCRTAKLQTDDPNADMELEEFRFRAEILWMNVRGERYQSHQEQALLEILTPHSDALVRLFGLDAPTLVAELGKILAKLTRGLSELFVDFEQFREEVLDGLAKLAEKTGLTDIEALRDKLFEDSRLASRRDRIIGELHGLDLFDVEKVTSLPTPLLDELSWFPGQEQEFFAQGDFRGWPLRIWPTMKRPFIRLNGRVLCFDVFALFDNFYRIMQRIIFRMEPGYKQVWNDRQKAVSEDLPFTYLSHILAGARIFKPVYYRWKVGTASAQWHEADGLLSYDDHLFVIEVKAGAFTYTSPATDLPAHIESLKNLARSPAIQGSRFVDYLESSTEVALFDAEHNEIGRVRRADFRHVTVCAVTLDAFTELAARANHLRSVGVDIGRRSVWVLSIDDLRAYSDLFRNPLRFLHFVEHRMLAAHSQLVDLFDEMDHLGLYWENNNYSMHAEGFGASNNTKLVFDGYRKRIDNYYDSKFNGESVEIPEQETPKRLSEIVGVLAASNKEKRSRIASFLLDASGEQRKTLATSIDQLINDNRTLRRARPMSTFGDFAFTLLVWSPPVPRDPTMALRHTQVVAAANGESSRLLLELEYSATGALLNVHWRFVDLTGLSLFELTDLQRAGRELRRSRVSIARAKGKIGRNNPCPCGSGKKYKRCCLQHDWS